MMKQMERAAVNVLCYHLIPTALTDTAVQYMRAH
jgi:hypothetical protein